MSHVLENLDQATIVIAGASSGFGRGAALELGRRGANVVVAARHGFNGGSGLSRSLGWRAEKER
jgi:NAD(P)-dependent dehydrogenase (short-subunit alcohol dehydrogenase family)